MRDSSRKFLLGLCFFAVVAFLWWFFEGAHLLTLDNILGAEEALREKVANAPFESAFFYFIFYIFITSLSLPGAAVLTLVGGAFLGLVKGFLLVSFASTIGATLACLLSRYFFRESVKNKFPLLLRKINEGLEREGGFYLFSLRMVPLVPFFALNAVMGVTQFPLVKFYIISQIGMLPGTFLFVYAGTQIGKITSLSDVLSPTLILSLTILGLLPLLSRRLLSCLRFLKLKRPRSYDYNLVIIGAGSGGLIAAYMAALLRAKVLLVEKDRMGGDCLNTGCVPSKALLSSAKKAFFQREGRAIDFKKVKASVEKAIKTIEPHDSVARYESLGVEVIRGEAKFMSPFVVQIGDRMVTARNSIIATGASPFVPEELRGLLSSRVLTSDTVWNLEELPENLVVLGGGAIGVELGQAFSRLGSKVVILEKAQRLLPQEEPEHSLRLQEVLSSEGVGVETEFEFERVDPENLFISGKNKRGESLNLPFSHLLLALGRVPNTQGLGLEEIGVKLDSNQRLQCDEFLKVRPFEHIYACGDVIGPHLFTHSASHQAWHSVINALFGFLKSTRVDYSLIPRVVYTEPEVASVGLTEFKAQQEGIDVEVTSYDMKQLNRAIVEGAEVGVLKILTVKGGHKILGASACAPGAGELISQLSLMMRNGLGMNHILRTVYAYPTWSESLKLAAGQWKRERTPQWAGPLLQNFHRWRRH